MATASRKPRIEFFWTEGDDPRVNWRLVGGNGETVCQSTQGFRDRTDASRSVDTVIALLPAVRRVGPGEKPLTSP